jgi:hypothetical protein
MDEKVAVGCRLGKGVFSDDRYIGVVLTGGKSLEGLAPIHYCWNGDGRPLGEGEGNGRDELIDGKVAARIVSRSSNGAVVVEIASVHGWPLNRGTVAVDDLCERPTEVPYGG